MFTPSPSTHLEDDKGDTRNHLRDPTLDHLRTVALSDDNYKALIDNVHNGFPTERHKADANVAPFWNIPYELSVDDGIVLYGPRIVVPKAVRREVLVRLHDSHQGVERAKRRVPDKASTGPVSAMQFRGQWPVAPSAKNCYLLNNESR